MGGRPPVTCGEGAAMARRRAARRTHPRRGRRLGRGARATRAAPEADRARAAAKRRTALAVAGGVLRANLPGGDPAGAARVGDALTRAVAISSGSELAGGVDMVQGVAWLTSVRRENPRSGHLDPASDRAR